MVFEMSNLIPYLLYLQVGLVEKNPSANAGDEGFISVLGRAPGAGNGNPVQNSCLENSKDRKFWWLQSIGLQRVGHN